MNDAAIQTAEPETIRLRGVLKSLLRRYQFRVVEVEEVKMAKSNSYRPPAQKPAPKTCGPQAESPYRPGAHEQPLGSLLRLRQQGGVGPRPVARRHALDERVVGRPDLDERQALGIVSGRGP